MQVVKAWITPNIKISCWAEACVGTMLSFAEPENNLLRIGNASFHYARGGLGTHYGSFHFIRNRKLPVFMISGALPLHLTIEDSQHGPRTSFSNSKLQQALSQNAAEAVPAFRAPLSALSRRVTSGTSCFAELLAYPKKDGSSVENSIEGPESFVSNLYYVRTSLIGKYSRSSDWKMNHLSEETNSLAEEDEPHGWKYLAFKDWVSDVWYVWQVARLSKYWFAKLLSPLWKAQSKNAKKWLRQLGSKSKVLKPMCDVRSLGSLENVIQHPLVQNRYEYYK